MRAGSAAARALVEHEVAVLRGLEEHERAARAFRVEVPLPVGLAMTFGGAGGERREEQQQGGGRRTRSFHRSGGRAGRFGNCGGGTRMARAVGAVEIHGIKSHCNASDGRLAMKLITWNIQWGRGVDGRVDLERIVRTARAIADFDVLCMQEIADNFPGPHGNDDRDQFAAARGAAARLHAYRGLRRGRGGRRRAAAALRQRDLLALLACSRRAATRCPGPRTRARNRCRAWRSRRRCRLPWGRMRVTTTHLEYYSDVQRRGAGAPASRPARRGVRTAPLQPGYPDRGRRPLRPHARRPRTRSSPADFNFPPENPAYDEIQEPLAERWARLPRRVGAASTATQPARADVLRA